MSRVEAGGGGATPLPIGKRRGRAGGRRSGLRGHRGVWRRAVKAVAAITLMKVRERCEGVPVQLREKVDPRHAYAELHRYKLQDVFPRAVHY